MSTLVLFTFAMLSDEVDYELQIIMGWVFIAVLVLNVAVNVLKGFYDSFKDIKHFVRHKLCKKRCMKKVKIDINHFFP